MTSQTTKVYFVRHGESEWNKLNLFCGWQDVHLSDKGEFDAIAISSAALLKENVKFDVGFTSALIRAQRSLNIILNSVHCSNIPIYSHWRLNERHYGRLTGYNKRQMAEVYGEEQVQVWRRSFDKPPPIITALNPYYESIRSNPRFKNIPDEEFPDSETLASTMARVIPYWENVIVPYIKRGKCAVVVAHGTSLRGIVKHIEGMSNEQIMRFNLPNSIPFVYEFDTQTGRAIGRMRFLADDATVTTAMAKVASLGEAAATADNPSS